MQKLVCRLFHGLKKYFEITGKVPFTPPPPPRWEVKNKNCSNKYSNLDAYKHELTDINS